MSEPEVLDGEAADVTEDRPSAAMVPAAAPSLAVAPKVTAADLVTRLQTIRDAADQAMQPDVDYGNVPGTDKPTLFKPGAEKLGVLFELDIQLENEKTWGPDDHLTVVSLATVYHAPSGTRLGFGEGICTTREKKYAKRRANRECPQCGAAAILLSKKEHEGWFCWRKRDGCGAQFPRDDQRLTSQEEGEVDNPNLPDSWNTVVKMAEKRARVDAVLAVTGASALFTQDMDDAAVPSERTTTQEEPPVAADGPVTKDQAHELGALLASSPISTDARTKFNTWAPENLKQSAALTLIQTLKENAEQGARMAAQMAGYTDIPDDPTA